MIFGIRAVIEAVEAGKDIDKILIKNLYKIIEYRNWNIKLKQANIIKNKIKGVFILRMEYVKIF